MLMLSSCADSIAVVPIFVNTGVTLLPVILAAVTSMVTLLFKPRELFRLIKKHPRRAIMIGFLGILICLGLSWFFKKNQAKSPREISFKSSTDWTSVALEIIRNKESQTTTLTAPISKSNLIEETFNQTPVIFRMDPSRSGYDGMGESVNLKPLWNHDEEFRIFLSTPAISGGRVYSASCLIDSGKSYGTLCCLDSHTGNILWKIESLDGEDLKGFFSSPAITADGKYLLIGEGLHFDKDSRLLCIDALNGKFHWRIKTPLHIEGSPAISHDMVVAGAGAIEDASHKPVGDPGFVFAARISDGKELWRYQVNDPESSPVIFDQTVYIGSGFNGNAVVALRTETDDELKEKHLNRLIWRRSTEFPATGAVTATDHLILVGTGNGDYVSSDLHPRGSVLALDRYDGSLRWNVQTRDAVLGALAVRDHTVICPVRSGEIMALNLEDGTEQWRQQISQGEPILAAAAFTGTLVYAVSRDGYLALLDGKNGKILEKHYINSKEKPGELGLCVSSPTLKNNCIFVGSETGGLWCFSGEKPQ